MGDRLGLLCSSESGSLSGCEPALWRDRVCRRNAWQSRKCLRWRGSGAFVVDSVYQPVCDTEMLRQLTQHLCAARDLVQPPPTPPHPHPGPAPERSSPATCIQLISLHFERRGKERASVEKSVRAWNERDHFDSHANPWKF